MLNKFLLTALVLMLSHTTVYAWVDCGKNVDCVPAFLATIKSIDQLKARVIVTSSTGKQWECTPIDWVGTCKIDNLGGPGNYYAEVSFGVTAHPPTDPPVPDWFHCDYYGSTPFYFDDLHQANITISLSGGCYWWWDDTATMTSKK